METISIYFRAFSRMSPRFQGIIIVGTLVVVSFMINAFTNHANSPIRNKIPSEVIAINTDTTQPMVLPIRVRLNSDFEAIDGFLSLEINTPVINDEITLFETTWSDIDDANNIDSLKQLALKSKIKLINLQQKYYPIMRKAWALQAKKEFWRSDIDVNYSGESNDVIRFTGALFATNANIEDFNNKIWDMLVKLRFSQAQYQWVKYADYTYYKTKSGNDRDRI